MANFNLADYETVEERIKRFYAEYPDGRIITDDYSNASDRTSGVWRVRASIYIGIGDQAAELPKSTGHAFEVDGTGGANRTSALENAETSAIGRALANMNLSGNKRASREEMQKVAAGEAQPPARKVVPDFSAKISALQTKHQARSLWSEAGAAGASKDVLRAIEAAAEKLTK